jgi:adenine deaminase
LLRAASLNPVKHYNLPVGLLREGDNADFIIIDHPDKFNVLETYIDGEKVFDSGQGVLFEKQSVRVVNHFVSRSVSENDFHIDIPEGARQLKVIRCFDGELVTDAFLKNIEGIKHLKSDTENDILKIAVVDRYQNKPAAVGFIHGFGLKSGAIASSVAHDSHNVVAVGVEDRHIARAVNMIMETKGGLSLSSDEYEELLPLPVAGLMSDKDGEEVGERYALIDKVAKKIGTKLKSPFMTLSFMSLLVIPKVKLGDKGLFDGDKFEFISLFE